MFFSQLCFLEQYVVEIIDHHAVTRTIPDSIAQTIKTMGSCSTLVAEQIMKDVDVLALPNEIKVLITSL